MPLLVSPTWWCTGLAPTSPSRPISPPSSRSSGAEHCRPAARRRRRGPELFEWCWTEIPSKAVASRHTCLYDRTYVRYPRDRSELGEGPRRTGPCRSRWRCGARAHRRARPHRAAGRRRQGAALRPHRRHRCLARRRRARRHRLRRRPHQHPPPPGPRRLAVAERLGDLPCSTRRCAPGGSPSTKPPTSPPPPSTTPRRRSSWSTSPPTATPASSKTVASRSWPRVTVPKNSTSEPQPSDRVQPVGPRRHVATPRRLPIADGAIVDKALDYFQTEIFDTARAVAPTNPSPPTAPTPSSPWPTPPSAATVPAPPRPTSRRGRVQ
jgi:hypothetical protein